MTTLIKAIVWAARRLARSPMAAVLFVSISDTPLDGEVRMAGACHSIARWLTQAGKLVAILYDSISPHRVRRDQQRHWREQETTRLAFHSGLGRWRCSDGLSRNIRRGPELGEFYALIFRWMRSRPCRSSTGANRSGILPIYRTKEIHFADWDRAGGRLPDARVICPPASLKT
jgi:hypothetical protein